MVECDKVPMFRFEYLFAAPSEPLRIDLSSQVTGLEPLNSAIWIRHALQEALKVLAGRTSAAETAPAQWSDWSQVRL
jgi:hypothetical protein